MMKTTLRLVLAFTFILLTTGLICAQRYVGHVSWWNSQSNLYSVKWDELTDVYFTSVSPKPDGRLDLNSYAFNMSFFNIIKAINPDKVWIVLGGADPSGAIPKNLNTICSNPTTRSTLVNELVNFAVSNNLKGIVIDWEFPKTTSEKNNHQMLITDLRNKISQSGLDIKLSAMVGAEYKTYTNHLQFINQAAINQLDYVDVMAFQFPSSYNSDHSTVSDVQNSLMAWAGSNSLGISVPKHKLGIGIATFGFNATRTFFREYKDESGYTTAFNSGLVSGLYYNSSAAIENKVKWGMQNGFGGVLLFDVLNDRPGTYSYHDVIFNTLLKNPLGATFANAIPVETQPSSTSNTNSRINSLNDISTVNHYTLSKVNNNLTNNYEDDYSTSAKHGQISDDVIYRLELKEESRVSVSTCQSDFDTYLHVLNSSKQEIAYNDDYGPSCVGTRASVVMGLLDGETENIYRGKFKNFLPAGIYYIVIEGYSSSSGNIQASVTVESKVSLTNKETQRVLEVDENYSPVTLAPNPASDQVVLTLTSDERAEVEIISSSGLPVKKLTFSNVENSIDVSDLTTGLYIIILKQGNVITREKLEVIR